jgi:hypothetical protein
MNKEFVPYAEALALKELGFDEPCLASWTYKTKERIPTLYGCGALLFDTDGLITNQTEDIICSAPLYQQAFRWFREKYSLNHFIDSTRNEGNYKYSIYKREKSESVFPYKWNVEYYSRIDCTTYEEAELECLKKLIEIVKTK